MTDRQIVSVHFPKAGGTSIAAQLRRLLPEQVELDYTHDPLGDDADARAPFPTGKQVVHGHFRPGRYADSGPVFLSTTLRHPVDNLVSIFDFWTGYPSRGNPWHDRFLRERPSIVQFARFGALRTLMSERYFGGFDMRRFDFVGFFETYRASVHGLGQLLSLPLRAEVHENRTQPREARDSQRDEPAIRAALCDLLADDIAFYERERARWEGAGVTPAPRSS